MIYISSSAIKSRSLDNCLAELIDLDIKNIELSGGLDYSENISESLMELKNRFSLNFLIHNYFPPPEEDFVLNIASSGDETRRRSIDMIKASIDLARKIGSDRYSVHAGYTKHFNPNPDGDYFIPDKSQDTSSGRALNIMHDSLSEIRKYAAGHKIKISVENLFPITDSPGSSLLCTDTEILEFLDSISLDKEMGFLLDLGHLSISSNMLGFDKDSLIETVAKKYHSRISGIHISGNDGKTDRHGPLSPGCWQLKAARLFNLEDIPVTLECRGLESAELLNQYNMVKQSLGRNNQRCCMT